MKRIELPRWLIATPIILICLAALHFGIVVIELGLRDYAAHVANAEADAIAYRNKKLSESIDDKILAWEKVRNCRE